MVGFIGYFFSIVFNLLVAFEFFRSVPILRWLWYRVWILSAKVYKGNVFCYLHGRTVVLPNGHWYILVIKKFKLFNSPLFWLYQFTSLQINQEFLVLDVGSAVGDSVLFLESKIRSLSTEKTLKMPKYLCIDGDDQYLKLSKFNLRHLKDRVELVLSMISSSGESIPEVLKIDPTTGSAVGGSTVESSTIDNIWQERKFPFIGLIKIDIDGYDGQALLGAQNLIRECRPFILFEWNVPLFDLTHNDSISPFTFLDELGYSNFTFFFNTGEFSHVASSANMDQILFLANYQRHNQYVPGFHHDIIVVPNEFYENWQNFLLNNG